MKIREKIINELDELSPTDYSSIYQFIWSIKSNRQVVNEKKCEHWYEEVRIALQGIGGDLSHDISIDREDRT